MAPKILQTARDFEQVRRFVMQCMNVDYQRLAPGIQAEIEKASRANNENEVRKLRDRLMELEVDWGTIPGSKPFLKQPGAEKFNLWLNIKPHYHKSVAELGDGHLEIVSYCTFHVKKTGEEIYEGPEASCSTMETNYRYIWAEAGFLPTQDVVDKGYQTKMGQWRYVDDWQKGKKVGRKKVWYIRIDNPNIHNERNKVRQIGQKRGLVKGTRNMGALSELFVAGPDEWEVPEEEPPDSPGVEKDYTPGGRKIYHDGVAPSGREQSREREMRQTQDKPMTPDATVMEKSKARGTWCEKHQSDYAKCPADEHSDAENEAMAVAEERAKKAETSPPPSTPENAAPAQQESQQSNIVAGETKVDPRGVGAGEIEIDYTGNPGPYQSEVSPIVRGDIAEITGPLNDAGMFWYSPDNWNHIKNSAVPHLLEVLKQLKYRVKITRPSSPSSTSPNDVRKARRTGAGGSPAASQRKPAAPTKEPVVLLGTIERVNHVISSSGKHMAYVTMKGKKRKYDLSCWDKDINEILDKAKGQVAEVYVLIKGKYKNLVGLKKVGETEFVDGKIPVVQRDREAGTPTLFKEQP